MRDNNVILEVKDLHKSFGEQEVLKGISTEVNRGDVIAIIGPSGCGKSTFLRSLNLLETPTSGQILFEGTDLTDKSTDINVTRQKIGMVFQQFNLFANMTIKANIMLAPVKLGVMTKDEASKKADELLTRIGLLDKADAYPAQLSGGQKQRVAIARALATNPKILLCDEATSALDPTTTKAILALLKEINEKYGITIVIITHEMAVVQEVCTHVAIIDEGNLAEHGTVEEVFSRPKSKAARKLVFQGEGTATYEEMKGKRCIRIVFSSNSSYEPVIANMILTCKAPVNILLADTRDIGGVAHGQMILQLPEEEAAAEKMIQYLKNRKLEVEELTNYVG